MSGTDQRAICAVCGGAVRRRTNVALRINDEDITQPWLHVFDVDWIDAPHEVVLAMVSADDIAKAPPRCPYCGRVMTVREGVEQDACNECFGATS